MGQQNGRFIKQDFQSFIQFFFIIHLLHSNGERTIRNFQNKRTTKLFSNLLIGIDVRFKQQHGEWRWNLFFFTFSWEEVGTPVYTFAAWIQSLMILALLIGTVRSFCTFSFPPTRRNGVILVVLWIEFLAYRLLTAPIADLLSAPEIPVTSMWALMALILMAGIASLILLAIVLTLSVRMAAAWRASHC